MKNLGTKLCVTLLMFLSSIVGYANVFPAIDINRVQERKEGVNQSLVFEIRNNKKSLLDNPLRQIKGESVFDVKMQSASISHVEGLQIFNVAEEYDKWWKLDVETGKSQSLWANTMLPGYNFNAGFVRKGIVYAVTGEVGYILKFDVVTGEYKGYISLGTSYADWILHATYDEENDKVYVYTYDESGSGLIFQTYNPETNTFTSIRTESGAGSLAADPLVAMALNPLDGFIYGVTLYEENWIKIDSQTGEWEIINGFDFSPALFVQSMIYTPKRFSFIYVAIDTKEEAYQIEIEPETGKILNKIRMYDEAEYAFMYCPDEIVEESSPVAPEIISIDSTIDSPLVTVKIGVPARTIVGDELTGLLSLVVEVDNKEYTTQKVAAGSEIDMPIVVAEEGLHSFRVYCKNGETKGMTAEKEFFIGYDKPAIPQNIVLTEDIVTWDVVTEGQYGGILESDVITYNVYISGQKINEEPITTNSLELNLDCQEIGKLQAEVEAVCGEKVSARGLSNVLAVGSYTLPLDLTITEDVIPYITVVDVNEDYSTWSWVTDHEHNAFEYNYHEYNNADDWAIIHKTTFPQDNQLYRIDLDVCTYSLYPEKFEIALSKTGNIDDMVVVVPEITVCSESVVTLGGQFKLDEAGDYYIGIHAISEADSYFLRLNKVSVSMSEAPNTVPQACENIVATAAEYGVLEATVELTLPTLALNNEVLDSEKDITVNLVSNVATTTITGKPGECISGVVKTEQGVNLITIIPENESGVGPESTVSIYTGVDVPRPAELTSVSVSADNRTMTFSWETSTEGMNGGFVDPAFVTYTILIYYPEQNYWFSEAGPGYESTEYSYTVPEGTPLKTVSLAVASQNAAGYMQEGPMAIASLGTPYEIPMLELFENQNLKYAPLTIEHPADEYSGSWDIVNPAAYVSEASNEESAALIAYATEEGNTYGQIALPKFNPQSKQEVMVKVRAYLYEGMADAIVSARGYKDTYSLGTISMVGREEGWHEFEFVLPQEVKDLQWAELVISATFSSMTEFLLIDKYEIAPFTGVETEFVSETVIYAAENAVVLENANVGDDVFVCTPDGKIVIAEKVCNNQMVIEISAGIYIVRCGNKIQKVIVR